MLSFIRLGAAALLLALAGNVPATAASWHLYAAPDGRFSVLFPVPPDVTPDSGNAQQITSSPNDHETYIVEYTPFDGSREYMSDKLFAAAKGSFTNGGGTILEVDAHNVLGHPAQDVEIRTKEGYIAWDRLMAVGDRVYQLLYISDHEDGTRPQYFWNSFRLNN